MIKKRYLVQIVIAIALLASAVLNVHNALLYHPSNGFDGMGHTEYIDYVAKYWTLPAPTAWETHQPPIFYYLAAFLKTTFNNPKAAQFTNIVVFFALIYIVWIALKKYF